MSYNLGPFAALEGCNMSVDSALVPSVGPLIQENNITLCCYIPSTLSSYSFKGTLKMYRDFRAPVKFTACFLLALATSSIKPA